MLQRVETKRSSRKNDQETGVKILNASLAEDVSGSVVLRGQIDMSSLPRLKVDEYQREVLARSGRGGGKPSRIRKGIESGARLPDIELGMRGDDFDARGKTVILNDDVYIIDGLQRVNAMLDYIADNSEIGNIPLIGAAVNFCTTKEWENERFDVLNQGTPVSPGVLLRNCRADHPSILTLYGLSSNDSSFALYKRVCWDQRMKQQEIIKALLLVRAATALHRSVQDQVLIAHGPLKRGTGRNISSKALTLDRIAKEIGLQSFRENVKDFFDLIDKCWGIRSIEYGEAQGHLRGNFLDVLGAFFSNNDQLWDSERRRIRVDNKAFERFKSFPINDPEIRRLCGSGSTSTIPILYKMLLDHMNKRLHKSNCFV